MGSNSSEERRRGSASAGASESATSRSLLVRLGGTDDPDQAAWDRLVALYAPLVMYWCRRRWQLSDADAADVFQEVFRAVALNIGGFRKDREGDTFRGWLRTITRNKVFDHFRAAEREPRGVGGTAVLRNLEQVADEPSSAPPDELEDPVAETAAEDALVHRALEQIQSQFKGRTWRAFWRTAVDGQSAVDVGEELGMRPGAVRVAKSRVLQRLREELGDVLE